jgi:HK97 family phage prohead protease
MDSQDMIAEFPDSDQRAAVCLNSWTDKAGVGVIHKITTLSVKDLDEDERSIKSIITTDNLDRDGEVVMTKGLKFSEIMVSGAVLFMHDQSKVIGRNVWVQKEKSGDGMRAVAKTMFAKTETANEVFELVKGGFIKGWSIGMDGITAKRRDLTENDLKKRPDWAGAMSVIEKANVLEYSAVSVPANADSITLAYEKGLIRATKAYFPKPKRHIQIRVPSFGVTVVRPKVKPLGVSVVRR